MTSRSGAGSLVALAEPHGPQDIGRKAKHHHKPTKLGGQYEHMAACYEAQDKQRRTAPCSRKVEPPALTLSDS